MTPDLPADHYDTSLTKSCKGKVLLGGHDVIDYGLSLKDSHRVCEEMSCGNAFKDFVSRGDKRPEARQAFQVSCLGPEERLGQCLTNMGTYKQPALSVFCTSEWAKEEEEVVGGGGGGGGEGGGGDGGGGGGES